jgi:hypothetical protein
MAAITFTPGIFDPSTRQLHALRESLCGEASTPAQPAWTLSDDEADWLVDALHTIDNSAGYLAYWAQLDGAETSALATIRETVASLLGAFGA